MTSGNSRQATISSNKPRIVGVLACALLLALCSSSEAQPQKRVPRIGYLASDSRAPTRDAFRQGLKDFGYVEGQSILIEWRFTEDKPDRFPEFAAELARLKVDAIVSGSSVAVAILRHTTSTIPIVMATYGGDPVVDGVVTSFAKPGGNITGVISLSPELSGKQLELLKETLPKLSRLAVMWNPDDSAARIQWQELETSAETFGVHLLSLEVKAPTELDKAIESAERGRVDALVVPRGGLSYLLRKKIVALAERHRLPGMYFASEFVEAGGLMSYSGNNDAQYRRAAYYVDKILKGTKPADIPVEAPTKFELVINLKTAKQIDVTIPPNVLARADRVIR
jgi:putative tryptophan/tyrosine transport system substrate-binding protein